VIEENEHENEMKNYSSKKNYYHESNLELNYYNSQNQNDESETNFFTSTRVFICRICAKTFSFNNELHKHVRQNLCENFKIIDRHVVENKISNESTTNLITDISIIESSVDSCKDIDTDFEFRDWIYVKTMINLFIKNNEIQICLDTDCNVILVDRNFIKIHATHYIVRRMTTSLNVRELDINKHETSEYIIAFIYFKEKITQKKVVRDVIERKIHLIDNFKVNMFIDNDILDFERIIIDEINNKVIISSCSDMIISIEIRIFVKEMINKKVHVRTTTIISFLSMMFIFIHNANLFKNRDFFFEFNDVNIFLYAYAIDFFIIFIMIKNDSLNVIKILRNSRLETIIEIQYSNAFHVSTNDEIKEYVERKSRRIHKTSWFNRVLKTVTIAYLIVTSASVFCFDRHKTSTDVILSNDVIIHNSSSQTVSTFFDLMNRYFDLWKSEEFVKLFENQWMRVSLRSDWESRIFEKVKIYSLETKDKKFVNQIFDDL
jgi:hypothetical protein